MTKSQCSLEICRIASVSRSPRIFLNFEKVGPGKATVEQRQMIVPDFLQSIDQIPPNELCAAEDEYFFQGSRL